MGKDHIVSVRLTEAERAALTARAEDLGITLSEMVRRAVSAALSPPPVVASETRTLTVGAPSTTSIVWNTAA